MSRSNNNNMCRIEMHFLKTVFRHSLDRKIIREFKADRAILTAPDRKSKDLDYYYCT